MRRTLLLTLVVSLFVGLLVACSPTAPAGYDVSADFSRAIGLFPGAPVRELGVDIGAVTRVSTADGNVRVSMHIDQGKKLPADVHALIVPMSLLGERYIQFTPIYTGGPALRPGTRIPLTRTTVPVEVDELLQGLKNFLQQVQPTSAADVVTNLAHVLQGEGDKLNGLVRHAAGTLQTLAAKGDSLGGLIDSLAQLTTTLQTRTAAIDGLINSYNTVSGVVADNKAATEGAVTQLNRATEQLASLLADHQQPLKQDVEALTRAGRSLDRNLDNVARTLAATPRLFAAAHNAYDPVHNWLPLNNQADPTTTGQLYASRLRDRLAGVCRRLIVKLGSQPGLTACADPNSGFFDPLLHLVPTTATTSAPSQDQLFRQGLDAIPGLTPDQKNALAGQNQASPTTTSTLVPSLTPLLPPIKLPAIHLERHTSGGGGLLNGIMRFGRDVARSVVDVFQGI